MNINDKYQTFMVLQKTPWTTEMTDYSAYFLGRSFSPEFFFSIGSVGAKSLCFTQEPIKLTNAPVMQEETALC